MSAREDRGEQPEKFRLYQRGKDSEGQSQKNKYNKKKINGKVAKCSRLVDL